MTEEQIRDREFLESTYGRRLRAYAETLFRGKIYGGVGPDDLVQNTIGRVAADQKEWQGQTAESLLGRLCTSIRNDFTDITRKYGLTRHGELSEAEKTERAYAATKKVLSDAYLASYVRFLKRQFPNDKEMHVFVDLWLRRYTAAEAAEMMGITENRAKKLRVRLLKTLRSSVTEEMIRGH